MSGLLALHIFAGSLALVSAGAALLVKKRRSTSSVGWALLLSFNGSNFFDCSGHGRADVQHLSFSRGAVFFLPCIFGLAFC